MVEVFTLVIVLLASGGAGSYTREFKTDLDCAMAAAAAHEAAQRAIGVLDIGTICVRSVLDPNKKPHA